ncbi:MAG: phosphate ABC transporter permease subunit PstC [Gemmatimonadota bacterium]|nr:phosphate ABC transporter permease subunit PstC [Gemmatimonadota bacterium]
MMPQGVAGAGTASRAAGERLVAHVLLACTVIAVVTLAAVLAVLVREAGLFLADVSPWRFLTEITWAPAAEEARFGVLPLVVGTVQIAVGAAVFALPVGVMTAVYLHQYASRRATRLLSGVTALMSSVPTVVYGLFALHFVTPVLQVLWPGVEAFNALSACMVVGLMILPTVTVLSREALDSVPAPLLNAGLALGAPKGRVVARILLPAASGGILAAVLIAMARAVGETMIVTLAAGNESRLTWSPFEGLQTLTAFLTQLGTGDAATGTREFQAFFAVGAVLFVGTYGIHMAGRMLVSRSVGRRGQ